MKDFAYQTPIIEKSLEHLLNKQNTCIAAAPNSGKTYMATRISEELCKNHNAKILILAHGQSILRTQWDTRLSEFGVETTLDVEDIKKGKNNILIQLPHSIYKLDLPKFDYVIVDEAHQFFHAKGSRKGVDAKTKESMMQQILDKVKCKAILALTGTPSKLIAKGGFEIIPYSGLDLHLAGRAAPHYTGLFTTNFNLKDSDFNKEDNLKAHKYGNKRVKEALEELLVQFDKRLRMKWGEKLGGSLIEEHEYIGKPLSDLAKKFVSKNLEKTLVIAHGQQQAKFICNWFNHKKQSIKAVVSVSEDDKNSDELYRFMDDPSIQVLVVVGRGILGFDMPELVNVVDMSMTRNPDIIYQAMCRVVRQYPGKPKKWKFFFKLITVNDEAMYSLYMNAALMLMFPDFLTTYNGKNLKQMDIFQIVKERKKKDTEDTKEPTKPTPSPTGGGSPGVKIDQGLFNYLNSNKVLIDINSNRRIEGCEVKYTTIEKAIAIMKGLNPWLYEDYTIHDMFEYVKQKFIEEGYDIDPNAKLEV